MYNLTENRYCKKIGERLNFLRKRLPENKKIFLFFSACVFPIHLWAIIQFLRDIPSYILWLDWFEIFSVFSYTQAMALFESTLTFLVFLLIALIFPHKLLLDHFPSQISLLFFLTVILIIIYHSFGTLFLVEGMNIITILLILLVYFIIIFLPYVIKLDLKRFDTLLIGLLENLTVLSSLYLIISIICCTFIIFRIIVTQINWL
jgi:hypothetical protein